MSGELVSPPRLKNAAIPKSINDIVMKAMAPELTRRYQRATDLLDDVLAARQAIAHAAAGTPVRSRRRQRGGRDDGQSIQTRSARAGNARGAVLLAMPQAAPRPYRSLPVLRGDTVIAAGPAASIWLALSATRRESRSC